MVYICFIPLFDNSNFALYKYNYIYKLNVFNSFYLYKIFLSLLYKDFPLYNISKVKYNNCYIIINLNNNSDGKFDKDFLNKKTVLVNKN